MEQVSCETASPPNDDEAIAIAALAAAVRANKADRIAQANADRLRWEAARVGAIARGEIALDGAGAYRYHAPA